MSKVITRAKAVREVVNAVPVGREAVLTQDQLVKQIEHIVVESGVEPDLAASLRVLLKTLKNAEELGLFAIHRQIVVERLK